MTASAMASFGDEEQISLMFHIVQGNKTPSFFELFFLKLN
jgi:hypothetical protein